MTKKYHPDYTALALQCTEKVCEEFARRLYKDDIEDGEEYTFKNNELFFVADNPYGTFYIADRYFQMEDIYEAVKYNYDPNLVIDWYDYMQKYDTELTRITLFAFVHCYKGEGFAKFASKQVLERTKENPIEDETIYDYDDFEEYIQEKLHKFSEENKKLFSNNKGEK